MVNHPIHPILVHFPIAFLITASAGDMAQLVGAWSDSQSVAWAMAAGVTTALIAMVAGMVDLAKLNGAAQRIAGFHIAAIGLSWIAYCIALYLRLEVFTASGHPPLASIISSFFGAAFLMAGGWFGGVMVYRYGAGSSV